MSYQYWLTTYISKQMGRGMDRKTKGLLSQLRRNNL